MGGAGFECCLLYLLFYLTGQVVITAGGQLMIEQDGQGDAVALLNENYEVVEKVPSLYSKTTEVLSSDTASDSEESAEVQDNDFSQTVGFNYGARCSDEEEIVDKDFSQTAMLDLKELECNLAVTKLKTVDSDSEEEEIVDKDFSQTARLDLKELECSLAATKLKTVNSEDEDSEEEELDDSSDDKSNGEEQVVDESLFSPKKKYNENNTPNATKSKILFRQTLSPDAWWNQQKTN
jgi:hypothetical protein